MKIEDVYTYPYVTNETRKRLKRRYKHGEKGFDEKLYSTQESISLVDSTGNRTQFRSMASASRYLGKNDGYISGLLAKGITQTIDGYAIVTSF